MYNPAREALKKAIDGKGKNIAFCWYAAGWRNVSPASENRREGISQLQKALELNPGYVNARYRLAFAYLVQDVNYNPGKALHEAQQAALLKPRAAKPLYYQALAYFAMKRYKTAYQFLSKAEKMEPGSIAPWMSNLYEEMAEKEQ
jgi:tetratricopeptide (TPR) repeat protein